MIFYENTISGSRVSHVCVGGREDGQTVKTDGQT
jgi:hypothetical protein